MTLFDVYGRKVSAELTKVDKSQCQSRPFLEICQLDIWKLSSILK